MAHPIHRAQPLVRTPDMQREEGGKEASQHRGNKAKDGEEQEEEGHKDGERRKSESSELKQVSDISRICKSHIPVSRTCSHTTVLL